MLRILRNYKRAHGRHHPLLAIDFENNPKTGGFICAGIAGDIRHQTTKRENGKIKNIWTTKYIEKYFTDQTKLFKFLLDLDRNDCMIVTYNLAYDCTYLDAITNHADSLYSGQRVIVIKLTNGLKAIDLFNHTMNGSLADWINWLDMTIKWGIAKADLLDYRNRVMNDARATYRLGDFLENFYFHECGIPLQLTVGAAAMKLFTMKYFTDYWARDDDFLSLYERSAYYGGRVEVFKRGKHKTYGYDVNSMYLSIIRDCVLPDIMTGKYVKNPPRKWLHYLSDYLGIWTIRVRTPIDIYLPVLPVRIGGKLKFPRGEFSGTWTSIEILEALKQGYEILQVFSFVYYRKSKHYFREFAKFIWGKRVEYRAKKNVGMDSMIKRIGNSLYGKFAQRNSMDYFGRAGDFSDLKKLPPNSKFFTYAGEVWLSTKKEATPAKFEFPCISAFITAYARLKLYEAMIKNQKSLIYCDTDSVKLSRQIKGVKVGADLGEWTYEIKGEVIPYYRPKMYANKRKGVPKRAKLISVNRLREIWEYDKPLRRKESIKNGRMPNQWVTTQKVLTYLDDKRDWIKNQSQPILFSG